MADLNLSVPSRRTGITSRRDGWWVQPLVVFLGLTTFVTYITWAAYQGDYYHYGSYLSPLYSPELFGDSPHSWLGSKPGWWPAFLPWSPALFVLWAPGLFRLTCYYYRGAYYKSFWADPPNCAVSEPRKKYLGERSFPLIMQNVHRYFFYVALFFLFFLLYDVWKGLWFTNPDTGQIKFGLGIGSLVLATNVVLLGGYTLGCHSLRHLIGGVLDTFSRSPVRFTAYRCASCLNRKHMNWAWLSLFWVAFSDLYIRLCSMGIWTDYRFF
jgi:hypothetical protein